MIDKTTSRIDRSRGRSRAVASARSLDVRRGEAVPAARNERIRLITFVWSGQTGDQPVIYADRSWVQ